MSILNKEIILTVVIESVSLIVLSSSEFVIKYSGSSGKFKSALIELMLLFNCSTGVWLDSKNLTNSFEVKSCEWSPTYSKKIKILSFLTCIVSSSNLKSNDYKKLASEGYNTF